ncbi:MAG TPA: ATP-binding cassette domain-containing protein, partial [Chitinophagales bacterium]|nr:ATP-binding cassette domain-containing protein [Chitinophagales bacterium]
TKGEIWLDGKLLNTYHKTYLRERIGVVLQKPFLFSTTIAQNIAYTRPYIEHNDIVTAAKAASIHEIMSIFPEGYDTLVGEKGVTLSGGQKQRVALARTLLEQPDMLILDDTTSAVDTETEFAIQRELQTYLTNKTSIIIANRIASVMNCTQILILDKGKIVQHGTHQTLLNQQGFYRKVYNIQTSNLTV